MSDDNPNQPLRIALVGYGKMGRMIDSLAAEANCEVVLRLDEFNNADRAGMTREAFADVDAAIEFSTPATVIGNIERLCELGVPVAIGTTGWYERIDEVRALAGQSEGGVIYGANFSVGVNAFYRVVEAAARAIQREWYPLMDVNFCETSPGPVKYAMSRMGLLEANYRLPMAPISAENRTKVDAVLAQLKLT